MGPPLPLLLLLLLPPPLPRALPAPASARGRQLPGRLGCLFEDGLCGSLETCVNDGVFGRCQKVPVMDTYRYEVPPGALLHLKVTLQKLSRTDNMNFGNNNNKKNYSTFSCQNSVTVCF
uniref:Ptprn2 protein n=1 Tax=Mus musculus TaxID=10090 RepID=Q8C8Z6_MOUSE|nr:Ptprn2 protein [Mus musculus]BAC31553.1 unnamed protein product [Mus musculus]